MANEPTLTLYMHPLSSFCWKALIAFYENDTPFKPFIVDQNTAGEFKKLWPIGKFPVLRDEARDRLIPESSIIIEYLDQHHPGRTRFLPEDADRARQTRMRDRFFDLYVHMPMQKIVGDRLRAAGRKDPQGVEDAHAQLEIAYDLIEEDLADKVWAMGDAFSLADCAAAPALYYANKVHPIGARGGIVSYLERLKARASFARTLTEAEPYFAMFPKADA